MFSDAELVRKFYLLNKSNLQKEKFYIGSIGSLENLIAFVRKQYGFDCTGGKKCCR